MELWEATNYWRNLYELNDYLECYICRCRGQSIETATGFPENQVWPRFRHHALSKEENLFFRKMRGETKEQKKKVAIFENANLLRDPHGIVNKNRKERSDRKSKYKKRKKNVFCNRRGVFFCKIIYDARNVTECILKKATSQQNVMNDMCKKSDNHVLFEKLPWLF